MTFVDSVILSNSKSDKENTTNIIIKYIINKILKK